MDLLKSEGFDVDYVEIADGETLCPVNKLDNRKVIGLIAATLDGVRLIDNLELTVAF
jgi:pantothenate synthetase